MSMRRYSDSVWNDGITAIANRRHPAHHMMQWQRNQSQCPRYLQMPEPFSGRSAHLGVAVVGFNPSIDFQEKVPTSQWNKADYFCFYEARFDYRDSGGRLCKQLLNNTLEQVAFWNAIERFFRGIQELREFGGFRLGEDGMLHEAIRYKSRDGWTGLNFKQRTDLEDQQRPFLHAALTATNAHVVLAVGRVAWNALRHMLDGLTASPKALRDACTQTPYVAGLGGRCIFVVPVKHLTNGRPTNHDLARARAAIKSAWLQRGQLGSRCRDLGAGLSGEKPS